MVRWANHCKDTVDAAARQGITHAHAGRKQQ
jgi:hypothetical protein